MMMIIEYIISSTFPPSPPQVALLSHASPELQRIAFEYGKNVGIAFQLVDDFLDFVGTEQEVGKPTSVDLKLGEASG